MAAGHYGAETLLIESGRSGGTCVNRGCIPKKITWKLAEINETFEVAKHYGFHTSGDTRIDYGQFKASRDAIGERFNHTYESNWRDDSIRLVRGRARFIDAKTIEVDTNASEKQSFTAKRILIAVGGYPSRLPISGAEYGITSDDFFDLEMLPRKVAVVGGGYVAVELADVMAALGTEVHMFTRGDTLLSKFDPMITKRTTEIYEAIGIHVHKRYGSFKEVQRIDGRMGQQKLLKLIQDDGSEYEVNELLWAIGRKPEIEDLDLEALSLNLSDSGHVAVDEYPNTSVEGVYAIGDSPLRPVASSLAVYFGPPEFKHAKLDYTNIPTVAFAHPEVGSVGMREPEARERFGDGEIRVYHKQFTDMYYDLLPPDEKRKHPTEVKIICAGTDEKIVGLRLLGVGVSEILQGFSVSIRMGATKNDFESCVAIHPTSVEELVTP